MKTNNPNTNRLQARRKNKLRKGMIAFLSNKSGKTQKQIVQSEGWSVSRTKVKFIVDYVSCKPKLKVTGKVNVRFVHGSFLSVAIFAPCDDWQAVLTCFIECQMNKPKAHKHHIIVRIKVNRKHDSFSFQTAYSTRMIESSGLALTNPSRYF